MPQASASQTTSATEPGPSERQLEALRLYAELGSAAAVADVMGISEQRVKNLLAKARAHLGGFRWTVEAVWAARAKGLM